MIKLYSDFVNIFIGNELNKTVLALKKLKVSLKEENDKQYAQLVNQKITLKNVLLYYKLSKVFNLRKIYKKAYGYIVSYFFRVSKTEYFLQLDFSYVRRILSSSELYIDSELEVMNSAIEWLSYDYENRIKLAEDLFLTVRFPLLPDHVVTDALRRYQTISSSFALHIDKKCIEQLEMFLHNKKYFYNDKSSLHYQNRYCSQKNCNILVCGGFNAKKNTKDCNVTIVDGKNFDKYKFLNQFPKCDFINVANVKNQFYMIAMFENKKSIIVQRYNFITNTWESTELVLNTYIKYLQVCSFLTKIFFIGGCNRRVGILKSCFNFDTITYETTSIKQMNEARVNSACAVFEGRVVVSGGRTIHSDNLKTIEAYDHVSNTWSYMPNMVHGRSGHALIAVRNNLYVLGGNTSVCEVLNSFSRKFTVLKSLSSVKDTGDYVMKEAFAIANKIMILKSGSAKLVVYDLETSELSEVPFNATRDIERYGCLKIAQVW